jgi:hypothetical protein
MSSSFSNLLFLLGAAVLASTRRPPIITARYMSAGG